ncbi:class I SAM-dependent methyltransferase [Pseudomonas typographi]|uniref:Methyltransferase n=1 Tax=Pseudomonas typographi TaxID=2715964 RepID=A0ABR7Z8S8_9PSED|nr:class I SAM-dependent methyltransferase [Pseudomonas typographi]MBD1553884.1 methyltransferase [Pseudomonas typographi]MBD1590041.1 methyltransferase [Pseudomonas typographi]MBD1601719.1 methyltransferase [Pseudomonas typographi]
MNTAALDLFQQLLRRALATPPAETRRLLHGRGRCWPGLEHLAVDWLEGVLQVQVFRPPADLQALCDRCRALATEQPAVKAVWLQQRYLPGSPGLWLLGEPRTQWQASENGLRYHLLLGHAQNNGLFLDMRTGRQWVREHVHGKRVLNLFAYTCAFSVCAIAGGAAQVVNLDMSRAALARGRDNHRLNGHALDRVRFLGHELFKSWGKVARGGPYDLVIIDPPTFQKGSFVLTQDYRKVLRKLPTLLAPGGDVLACVNDPALGAGFIIGCMAAEAPALQFVERLENPPEFPDCEPDGGLKVLRFHWGNTAVGPCIAAAQP